MPLEVVRSADGSCLLATRVPCLNRARPHFGLVEVVNVHRRGQEGAHGASRLSDRACCALDWRQTRPPRPPCRSGCGPSRRGPSCTPPRCETRSTVLAGGGSTDVGSRWEKPGGLRCCRVMGFGPPPPTGPDREERAGLRAKLFCVKVDTAIQNTRKSGLVLCHPSR